MPRFISKDGEWFPEDEMTKKELEAQGIDHLGIHVSEDPYIKNLEAVTGIPRRELVAQRQEAMNQMLQQQMLLMQKANLLAQLGDKESALRVLSQIDSQNAKLKETNEKVEVDVVKLKKEEFEKSMAPKRRLGRPPKKKLPEVSEEVPIVHEAVDNPLAEAEGVRTGFGKA